MRLVADELSVCYAGQPVRALDCVSIAVPGGTTLAVIGPSGSGKTTLLRAIAGLVHASGGDVRLGDDSIANLPPQERRIAVVFQDDALFPNMTLRGNLHFAMRRNAPAGAVAATARALHVEQYLDRRPHQLSGGERQRASIARALLSDPLALLLDEPLAHLDPSLRRSVRDEVLGVRQRFAGPILYVTHDHVEAMSVGDVLAVLIDGRLQDVGEPRRIYERPGTIGVARFFGERPMNLLHEERTIVGIRPECIELAASGDVSGRIARREPTGADAYLDVETARGSVVVRVPASHRAACGDLVRLRFPPESVRRFDTATGVAIQ